ncbi:unnamed protein product [Effrenium voratum]|uniref:Uncharacterized protein n=1 Tax=Effrenium voratum TaxID=2562239 RepID=A0AA36JDY9_9DINO|nr:unnamed protein product [Effrenium voratum]
MAKHVIRCPDDLQKVAAKAPNAQVVIPELADEESPEGWQILGQTPHRVEASVQEMLSKALHDLQHEIPEQVRDLPQVKEQVSKLQELLSCSKEFSMEIRDATVIDQADIGSKTDVQKEDEAPSWVQAFLEGCDAREHGPSQWKDPPSSTPIELGSAPSLRRCVIAPGNGCSPVAEANWYAWLAAQLRSSGVFEEVILRDFPDPDAARREVWLGFLKDLRVGVDTVLVGHSSGAQAAMRLAEEQIVGGLVLVAACHSDLGDAGERASGYYPPSGGPWQWDKIRQHCGWIVQFHSSDDCLVPVVEGRRVAKELQSEFHELQGHSHFFEPFEEILEAIVQKCRD